MTPEERHGACVALANASAVFAQHTVAAREARRTVLRIARALVVDPALTDAEVIGKASKVLLETLPPKG